MDWTAISIAAIPGIMSLFAVIYQARKDRQTQEATAAKIITEAAAEAVELYRSQFEDCEDKLVKMEVRMEGWEKEKDELNNCISKLQERVRDLENQIKDLGCEPV